MIEFTQGNLLEDDAEALVNTVNTVGVMGKGVALMFKETFPENFEAYEAACKAKKVVLGKMFVSKRDALFGPRWIINFPTKAHWRYPSQIAWIEDGLRDLVAIVHREGIRSIALPPLGAGNGGLDWNEVKPLIVSAFAELSAVHVRIYEPTRQYQNVAKRTGVDKLTPTKALIAELVRRYSILGIECTLLEVQKLGYLVERYINLLGVDGPRFDFSANKYGPYSDKLRHLLNSLDGSYLHCERRISDAGPFEPIQFADEKRSKVAAFLTTPESKPYVPALEATSRLIDGFESPLGMELLSTVDWLLNHQKVDANVAAVKAALEEWTGGRSAGQRKLKLFEDRIIELALEALQHGGLRSQQIST